MSQRIIKRDKNFLIQAPIPSISTSIIYPFVINSPIASKTGLLRVGQITIPVVPGTRILGDLFIQAKIVNNNTYSPMLINVSVTLGESDVTILNETVELDKTFSPSDYYKIPINISGETNTNNGKLVLIITAKNKGPNTGQFNVINLVYFEKKS